MAELPSKVHVQPHPMCLMLRRRSVYEDENQRTWLQFLMETGSALQVRLRQEDIPRGHIALTSSPLTSITMWTLHSSGQYVDPMCRFWHIVHHVKENGVEEMILELKEHS